MISKEQQEIISTFKKSINKALDNSDCLTASQSFKLKNIFFNLEQFEKGKFLSTIDRKLENYYPLIVNGLESIELKQKQGDQMQAKFTIFDKISWIHPESDEHNVSVIQDISYDRHHGTTYSISTIYDDSISGKVFEHDCKLATEEEIASLIPNVDSDINNIIESTPHPTVGLDT